MGMGRDGGPAMDSSSLSPNVMVKEKEIIKFQVLAERFFKLMWLTAHGTDDADLQYDEFIDSQCSKYREKFVTFNKSTDAIDLLLDEFLDKNQIYISFWRRCGIIFVLFFMVKVLSKEDAASINNC